MNSLVSERGQVTIPKPLRDRMGIRSGDVLDFEERDGRLVATKLLAGISDPIDAVTGVIDVGCSTDEAIELARGSADLL